MESSSLRPEDLLHFVQLDEFVDDWQALGFDLEKDLWDLEVAIMSNPEASRVIPETGGLRKLRFARQREGIGKRGGVRVCYVYFKEHFVALLVVAYGKNEKDDLTATEKKHIREYIRRSRVWLDQQAEAKKGPGHG